VPLPRAPEIIEGIINIRGKVVPVLDVRSRFRLAPQPLHPSNQFIVAIADGRTVALRVDQVTRIAAIADRDIEDAKAVVPRSDYVAGVARLPEGLVLLHDLDAFLSHAESEEMDAAVDRVTA